MLAPGQAGLKMLVFVLGKKKKSCSERKTIAPRYQIVRPLVCI